MGVKKVRMLVNAFFGDNEIELCFPGSWSVTECRIAGHDKAPLTADEMRESLKRPYGSPLLSDLARDAKEVCILFDDLPKPTPTKDIVPFVLEELHAGGITDDHIRFLCAPGTHHPLTYPEFVAKLGKEVVEKYPVYNHTIWENLVYLGETSRGTPVHVNREFSSCDLRVGIGSVFPHGAAGFGGGGKLVLPGVCGIETIYHHHTKMKEGAGMVVIEGNVFRMDIEEAARLAGLQFKVDAVINNRRQVIGLYAGDFVEEHRAAVAQARELYQGELTEDADVVIANSYPDEGQISRSLRYVDAMIREGGDLVIVNHSYEGQNLHQLSSRFGSDYGGRAYNPGRFNDAVKKAGRIFVLAPHLSRYDRDTIGPEGKVVWGTSWAEILADLVVKNGAGSKVAVLPYAPLFIAEDAPAISSV